MHQYRHPIEENKILLTFKKYKRKTLTESIEIRQINIGKEIHRRKFIISNRINGQVKRSHI